MIGRCVLSLMLGLSVARTAAAADPPLALDGKCPVCVAKMGKLVEGKPEFTSTFDGKTYRFPSAEQKGMFDKDPAAFAPALGGDCVVCLVDKGERVAGKPEHFVVHKDRLYLFPAEEQKRMFEQNPGKYAGADLALGGSCPVCLVKMNQVVPGKPEIASVYDGQRYLFPGPEQKEMFEKDPAAFAPALGGNCTVCKVEMKKNVPGDAKYHLAQAGRLFVFASEQQLNMFKQQPDKYAKVDLALNGNCAICKVDMNKDVPGKPEFAVDHHGQRYLFPSADLREKFERDPEKYAVN